MDPKTTSAYLYEAQSWQRAGDLAGARQALERGLAALPGESQITAALATLPAK